MASMIGGDEVGAVVLEVGTHRTKAGYAGDDQPKHCFPSYVGVMYSTGNENVVGEPAKAVGDEMDVDTAVPKKRDFFVGTETLTYRRDNMEVQHPLDMGLVKDWEIVECLWSHSFSRMRVNAKERALLLVEPSFNTKENREKMTELAFEKYEVPALFVAKDAVLNCFATGRSSGMVVDCGAGKTSVTPVYDGYVLQQGISVSHIGGNRLNVHVKDLIEAKYPKCVIRPFYQVQKKEVGGRLKVNISEYPNTHPSYFEYMQNEIISDIRHSISQISDVSYDKSISSTIPTTPYELPHGKKLELGGERFEIPEALFNTEFLKRHEAIDGDKPFVSLQHLISDSIGKCDVDIRKELLSGLIVSGGNCLYSGFNERLNIELGTLLPHKIKIVASNNPTERKYASWIGGSILGSLGSFQQLWISRSEYEERGKAIVERKCP